MCASSIGGAGAEQSSYSAPLCAVAMGEYRPHAASLCVWRASAPTDPASYAGWAILCVRTLVCVCVCVLSRSLPLCMDGVDMCSSVRACSVGELRAGWGGSVACKVLAAASYSVASSSLCSSLVLCAGVERVGWARTESQSVPSFLSRQPIGRPRPGLVHHVCTVVGRSPRRLGRPERRCP